MTRPNCPCVLGILRSMCCHFLRERDPTVVSRWLYFVYASTPHRRCRQPCR
uniref:Uncharacterized protein n=1 Tax=Arundo donax TaxID=35708 RepID=A0A0A9EEQ0_ARUDO